MSANECSKNRWYQFEGLLTDNTIFTVYIGRWGGYPPLLDEDADIIESGCRAYVHLFGEEGDWVGYRVEEYTPPEFDAFPGVGMMVDDDEDLPF
jgi:hypothetical protein